MANKFFDETTPDPKQIAKHLRQPEGEMGVEIGIQMNKGNKHMCENAINELKLQDNECVLEVGMGNGHFVEYLMSLAQNLKYTGADFSSTMVKEANTINKEIAKKHSVKFVEASVEKLPFEDNSFDVITTANTIYFWPNAIENSKELQRVLKPGGRIVAAYRTKSLMSSIEFTKYGFSMYEVDEVEELFIGADYINVATTKLREPELDFGDKVLAMEGMYTTAYKKK